MNRCTPDEIKEHCSRLKLSQLTTVFIEKLVRDLQKRSRVNDLVWKFLERQPEPQTRAEFVTVWESADRLHRSLIDQGVTKGQSRVKSKAVQAQRLFRQRRPIRPTSDMLRPIE
jgi:hypothetical protein